MFFSSIPGNSAGQHQDVAGFVSRQLGAVIHAAP
jgi:hypothetical protein